MRYRVDLDYGNISYDEKDYDKAMELYKERGIRILRCNDIFDDGTLLEGAMVFEDHSNDSFN